MKTIIVYYSFSGKTKKYAHELAAKENADVFSLKAEKPRTVLGAFLVGAPAAMRRKSARIGTLGFGFEEYDKIILAAPIWAGYPAPAFNSAVQLLPEGKQVELHFTSGSGDSSKSAQGTKDLIAGRGCELLAYIDVKL